MLSRYDTKMEKTIIQYSRYCIPFLLRFCLYFLLSTCLSSLQLILSFFSPPPFFSISISSITFQSWLLIWVGIFKKSMGARHRVGIGLLYRPARVHRLAEFIPWNRFRGPIHVQKYQLVFSPFRLYLIIYSVLLDLLLILSISFPLFHSLLFYLFFFIIYLFLSFIPFPPFPYILSLSLPHFIYFSLSFFSPPPSMWWPP